MRNRRDPHRRFARRPENPDCVPIWTSVTIGPPTGNRRVKVSRHRFVTGAGDGEKRGGIRSFMLHGHLQGFGLDRRGAV